MQNIVWYAANQYCKVTEVLVYFVTEISTEYVNRLGRRKGWPDSPLSRMGAGMTGDHPKG